MKKTLAPLCVAVLAVACGGGGSSSSGEGGQAAPPPATAMAAALPPAGEAGDFGVAECDAYMKKVQACLDTHVPEATRAMVRQSVEQTRASWKLAATTPEGRASLTTACTQALAAAKAAYTPYGCSF